VVELQPSVTKSGTVRSRRPEVEIEKLMQGYAAISI